MMLSSIQNPGLNAVSLRHEGIHESETHEKGAESPMIKKVYPHLDTLTCELEESISGATETLVSTEHCSFSNDMIVTTKHDSSSNETQRPSLLRKEISSFEVEEEEDITIPIFVGQSVALAIILMRDAMESIHKHFFAPSVISREEYTSTNNDLIVVVDDVLSMGSFPDDDRYNNDGENIDAQLIPPIPSMDIDIVEEQAPSSNDQPWLISR